MSMTSPVLVHIWAMSCPACKANMPDLQKLRDTYGEKGLQVVAIHMPRGEFDLDIEKVKAVAIELGVTEPCAIDNEHTLGERFGVDAFPTYFLFGADGRLKRHAKGNFGVRMIEQALLRMYGEEPAEG
jgi:thiol-disulfide isomerase/thioredoxin